ncbi:flippase [Acidithiobacillus ferrivorans]|nr:flippase [Acidithiobacillus ferrivorans]
MTDIRKLLGNMTSLFTLQGANFFLPLVTLPYLVRILGPEKIGLIAFAQAFIQYMVVITDYGFNLSATRDVTLKRNSPEELNDIITAVLIIKSCLAIAGGVAIIILISTIKLFQEHKTLYLAAYITVLGSALFPLWLFQGLERMRDISKLLIASRLITTAAIFIFIHNPGDYVYAAIIQSLPMLLATLPAWIIIKNSHSYAWKSPKLTTIKQQLNNGWHIFLSTSAINIYSNSNLFILGIVTGPIAVAYFSVANKISSAVIGLYQPIVNTLYPHVSNLSSKNRQEAITFIRKIFPIFIAVGLISSMTLFLLAPEIIRIVAGSNYQDSVPVLKFLSPLPLLLAFGLLFGGLTMLPLGMTKLFSWITITAAIVDLLAIYPLVINFAEQGAAISNVITELYVSTIMAFIIVHKKILSIPNATKDDVA